MPLSLVDEAGVFTHYVNKPLGPTNPTSEAQLARAVLRGGAVVVSLLAGSQVVGVGSARHGTCRRVSSGNGSSWIRRCRARSSNLRSRRAVPAARLDPTTEGRNTASETASRSIKRFQNATAFSSSMPLQFVFLVATRSRHQPIPENAASRARRRCRRPGAALSVSARLRRRSHRPRSVVACCLCTCASDTETRRCTPRGPFCLKTLTTRAR